MTQAKKRWSYCTGERGRNRVRAFEHTETGRLFLEFADRGRRSRVALRHGDRNAAKAKAEELAAALRSGEPSGRAATLRTLFDIYVREVSPGKGGSAQRHDRAGVRRFTEFLGASRTPETLNRRDWDGFIRWRKDRGDERARTGPTAGQNKGQNTGPTTEKRRVGNRVIEQDLKFLHAVLNWATLARDDNGAPLLERNPLKGMPWPKQPSPRRVMLTAEEYQAIEKVAREVSPLFELALILAHETGHRIGSIRLLKWSDLDLEEGRIRWRAEHDKIGFEHETFLTAAVLEALAKARSERPSIGDTWLFPAPGNPTVPCSRHLFRDWWERAQELAGLKKEPGRGWHSLRRKFATDLKHVPLRDLCYLGGWKEPQTVLKCYQRPDEATMRQALASRAPRPNRHRNRHRKPRRAETESPAGSHNIQQGLQMIRNGPG
jgi:integrase